MQQQCGILKSNISFMTFICDINGRDASVSEAREELGLQTLEDRRKRLRMSLLMRILSNEESHSVLSSTYDELMNDRANVTMTTRAAARGEPTAISALSTVYHTSFLPRTVRDVRNRLHK